MEPFDHLNKNAHHVVAVFEKTSDLESVITHVRTLGIADEQFSVLIQYGNEPPANEERGNAVKEVLGGGGLGGVLGFLTGAVVFGIPGAGTVVGVGLWTATAIGTAIGATVGLEISDYHHAWESLYRTAIKDGKQFIAVSLDDPLTAATIAASFADAEAIQIDHFDHHGRRKPL